MFPPWLQTAFKEMEAGVKEIPGPEHNQRILEYWKFVNYKAKSDEISWCSAGMNFCFESNGIRGTRKANARSWLKWGEVLTQPRVGCVTIFYRGDPKSWTGHVALYLRHLSKKTIEVIGGNQRDRWTVEPFPLRRVLGWRWPQGVVDGNYQFDSRVH